MSPWCSQFSCSLGNHFPTYFTPPLCSRQEACGCGCMINTEMKLSSTLSAVWVGSEETRAFLGPRLFFLLSRLHGFHGWKCSLWFPNKPDWVILYHEIQSLILYHEIVLREQPISEKIYRSICVFTLMIIYLFLLSTWEVPVHCGIFSSSCL